MPRDIQGKILWPHSHDAIHIQHAAISKNPPNIGVVFCWTKIRQGCTTQSPLKNQPKCQNNMFNCSTHIHPYNIIHVLKKKLAVWKGMGILIQKKHMQLLLK